MVSDDDVCFTHYPFSVF